jgi:multidrug efflux pump subunit AcrA (membrane-fusion protein)
MLLGVLAALALLTGCSGPYSAGKVAAKEQKSVSVSVETVALTTIPETIPANGELLAEEQATVSAKVPGRIAKLHVDLGSAVKEGDTLADIEREDYQFRVRQAEALVEQTRARLGISGQAGDEVVPENTAMVRQAAASLKEARFISGNTTKLAKEGVLSNVDMEKSGVALQAAEARYQAALEDVMQLRAQLTERRAQLALARQQLADCAIKAPFSGSITKRLASLGEYLAVNSPVVQVVRQHPLRVRLEVPERSAAKVRPGQRIDLSFEASPAKPSGRVVRLSPSIEAQNRSLTVEGEIPNADGALKPGSFVEAVITVNAGARGIAAPAKSVVTFAGVERMFVVSNGMLDERLVKTGRTLGDRVEIVSGLQPGDSLVVDATDRMAKGMKADVRSARP